jgi:hypothetical protein
VKLSILAGATSQTINVFIRDSSSTTGAGLTGLVYNTSSLTAYYALPKAAAVQITLATLAAVTSAYSSGGFKEIDATNMPGWYRLDLPDAAIASGRFVSLHLKGATNMAPLPVEIELTAWNNQDGVRGGMTALPSAAAEAAGGLVTRGTGTGQISVSSGQVIVQSGTGAGQLDFTLGVVKANAVQLLGTAWLTPGVAGTPDVNAKQVGGQTASASGTVTFPAATLASTTNITAGTVTTVSGNVAGSVGSVTGAVGSVTGNVGGNVTGSVGSVTAAVTLSAADSPALATGTATAGSSNTITLQTALGTDDLVAGSLVKITSGTGAKQTRVVIAYDNATKVAVVDRNWVTNPDSTSVYAVLYQDQTPLSSSLYAVVDSVVQTLSVNVASVSANAITAGAIASNAITAAKIATDAITAAKIDATFGAEIADAVWDELQSGHTTAGSFGKFLDAAVSGVSTGGVSAADIATAVWTDLLAGSDFSTVASIGKLLKDNLDATVSSRSTYAGGDTNGTTTLLSRLSAARAVYLDNVNNAALLTTAAQTGDAFARVGAAGAGLTALGDARLANLDAAVSTRGTSTVTAAQVNAEVVDALSVDTYAEPAGAPAATATLAAKIGRIYQALRNKIDVSASAKTFYDDAGAALWSKALSDNGTDYVEAKGS